MELYQIVKIFLGRAPGPPSYLENIPYPPEPQWVNALPRVQDPWAATDLNDLQMYLNTITQSRTNLNIKVKFGNKLSIVVSVCVDPVVNLEEIFTASWYTAKLFYLYVTLHLFKIKYQTLLVF